LHKYSSNDTEGRSTSLATAQFNRPHIIFCKWSVVTMCLSSTVSEIFYVE